ncbi:hypothetical protein ACM7P1_11215 [Pseudomonas aeruginosa]|uniref:hypothetical protein n=1 Tax=Pseudomonas TaxID=286 RepID=UPI000F547FBF|nr:MULTISPECIES: hypothetical protein [Pseudomonas]MBW6388139.1 hypothetical protein [Pseudomonas aeruginosa]MBX5941809.1 hypothetical protein [Pseudomonas aeruginosa]MDI9296806.1 hypothetical protein [Pseudomonas aeruginosa]RQD58838.1 hypothetical protein IPC321_12470 [Pseudomonas aeruginosa]HCF2623345.1 hypothetical protein [Pseudomonas aeruginosa]
MKRFSQEHYDVHHVGSFGRFFSGGSFPVDYLQASFTAADLLDLTFAQDLHPDGQDFELLMQRDIDKERVLKSVVPYINPLNSADQKNRSIFFPPLLVAIVPVKNKAMQPYYPDEKVDVDVKEGVLYREWPGQLKIQFYLDSGISAYSQKLLKDGNLEEFKVDKSPVRLSIRKPKGSEAGASLVVIDGQHRLAALMHVYKLNPAVLDGVCVPVCILFPPNSTLAYKEYMKEEVLTVHSVFRSLFVDVNTTMQHVGGHFSILLSDSSLSGIICRRFCDAVFKKHNARGLAQIEWNIKSKKDATIINRPYSITSIGILDKALTKAFAGSSNGKSSLLSFVLALPEVEAQLYAGDSDGDDDEPSVIEWEHFSLHQKKVIEGQVAKHVVPCLEEIFFNMDGYKSLHKKFCNALDALEAERDASPSPEFYNSAIQQILDYKPIEDEKAYRRSKDICAAFENEIESAFDGHVEGLLQYAIVQRGILDAWSVLLDKLKDLAVTPLKITQSFVMLLNLAFRNDGELLKPQKLYMQYTVWETVNIKPTEESRAAIANCILTLLATDSVADDFSKSLGLDVDSAAKVAERLRILGVARAGDLIGQYHKLRQKYFLKTYKVEFALLSDDERAMLSSMEEEYQKQLQEVRENQRKQEEVSNEFQVQVEKYVGRDVKRAISDFRKTFKYDGGIAVEEKFADVEAE